MELIYWTVRLSGRRNGDRLKGVDGGHSYFNPTASFTILKIWCYIQAIIYPLQAQIFILKPEDFIFYYDIRSFFMGLGHL